MERGSNVKVSRVDITCMSVSLAFGKIWSRIMIPIPYTYHRGLCFLIVN